MLELLDNAYPPILCRIKSGPYSLIDRSRWAVLAGLIPLVLAIYMLTIALTIFY
jgi:hypothetical protein